MNPALSAAIFAARELAWQSHVNLSDKKRYAHRLELHQRLVDALAKTTPLSANASPELRYLVEAIHRVAALPGWSLDFATARWLILTDPDGAAAIVAKDVDLEYGGDIAEHWRRAALIEGSDPASPEAPVTGEGQ